MRSTILVTGGAGYIGTHVCFELVENGYNVVLIDNFLNSSPDAITAIRRLVMDKTEVTFVYGDLFDMSLLDKVFESYPISAVIHLAGLKAVGESVQKPLLYYDHNINTTINLLKAMEQHNCFHLIFSSSATVYGIGKDMPLTEEHGVEPVNPYGRTKLCIEYMLKDICTSDTRWSVCCLRYFNPIGCHPSGTLGENPVDQPNNLMPYIARVASRQLPVLKIFGNDYPTHDGTGIRDYIHVVDLAQGHVAALATPKTGFDIYNLGTGRGYSVLELVKEMGNTCGKPIPYEIVARRPGDCAVCYADCSKAQSELGWYAKRTLSNCCNDMWNWIQKCNLFSK